MTFTPRSTVIWMTPFPIAHGRFAGVLIGPGPPQHRQHRGDADSGVVARLAELGDQTVVGPVGG